MLKKILLPLIILGLIILGVVSPWDKLTIDNIIGVPDKLSYASLQISSLSGDIMVALDDREIGVSSLGSEPFVYNSVEVGTHKITLSRQGYATVSKEIYFADGVGVVGAYELGPTQDSVAGYFLYAISSDNTSSNTVVDINVEEKDVNIIVDDEEIGISPVANRVLDVSKQYEVRFSKLGYLPLEFTMLPSDEAQRNRIKGSKLIIEADLYQIPITPNVD